MIITEGKHEITAELVGDREEDLSPELLDKIRKAQADKKKKETEKGDSRQQKEREYPLIYGGPCTGANEFNVMVYTLAKMGLLAFLLALTVKTMAGEYDLKECYLVDGKCLFRNASHVCTTTSTRACNQLCLSQFQDQIAQSGCFQFVANETYSCITDFAKQCLVTDTCPPDNSIKMKDSLKLTAIIVGVAIGLDALYVLAMLLFKGLHVNDFDRLNGFQKVMTFYTKVWGFLSQLTWIVSVIAALLIISTYGSQGAVCSKAETSSGAKYELFSDSLLVAIVSFIIHIAAIGLGTYVRSRIPLRGHLYRPSADTEVSVPFGLDCKECRDKPRPRWASGVFQPHMQKENVVGCVCNCCSFIIDSVCCVTLEIGGYALERLYKHRHFIGP